MLFRSADGRFCASGTVEASVLYIPEKEEGLRSLHFEIPFQCYGEGQGDASCENLDIRGELRGIDTRVLNPRKVLTRANLVLYPTLCRHVSLSVCTGVAEDAGEGVQLLREEKQTRSLSIILKVSGLNSLKKSHRLISSVNKLSPGNASSTRTSKTDSLKNNSTPSK